MGIVEDDHKDKNSESFSNVNRPEFLLFSQKRRFGLLEKDAWQIMSKYKCCLETYTLGNVMNPSCNRIKTY